MTAVAFLSVFGSTCHAAGSARFLDIASTLAVLSIFVILVIVPAPTVVPRRRRDHREFLLCPVVSFCIVLLAIQAMFSGRLETDHRRDWFDRRHVLSRSAFPMGTMQFACAALAYFGSSVRCAGSWSIERRPCLHGGLLIVLAVALPVAIILHPTFELMVRVSARQGAIGIGVPVGRFLRFCFYGPADCDARSALSVR